MSNHGRLTRDGIFNNLQVGDKVVIDGECNAVLNNACVKGDLKVKGNIIGLPPAWQSVSLPDSDQMAWAPENRTRYFQTDLTTTRTLTLSQASLNAAYPNATNQTLIEFDFPLFQPTNLDLHTEDVNGVYLNNYLSSPYTFNDIEHMKGGYVAKTGSEGEWLLCLPDIRYD